MGAEYEWAYWALHERGSLRDCKAAYCHWRTGRIELFVPDVWGTPGSVFRVRAHGAYRGQGARGAHDSRGRWACRDGNGRAELASACEVLGLGAVSARSARPSRICPVARGRPDIYGVTNARYPSLGAAAARFAGACCDGRARVPRCGADGGREAGDGRHRIIAARRVGDDRTSAGPAYVGRLSLTNRR